MDTAEGTGPSTYDGFISYSHAADDLLAPRLQAGLQRFAKPWWKRRALRIFRDESSLSANPHLWSSITEAMDASGWFVLLLSPDAANSEWVNQEITYWVENRDPGRILPVVTDGEFGWSAGDVEGSAVPAALRGAFSEEPRWVDLRWARDEDQLDLQDPRFADAVADIASTIRGVPKDELASEEVRQHRRTVRTAWAASGLVTVLAIAAVGFGIQSARNADEAEANAQLASQEADRANSNAIEAQANADEAERQSGIAQDNEQDALLNAEIAQRQAVLAKSRELGAAAVEALEVGRDPKLSTLLALESLRLAGSIDEQPRTLIDTLFRGVTEDRLLQIIETGISGFQHIVLSPDGTKLFWSPEGGDSVRMYSVSDGSVLWEFTEVSSDTNLVPSFHPDGSRVAFAVGDSVGVPGSPGYDVKARQPDDLPNRLIILDADTGMELDRIEFPECGAVGAWGWSPDGELFSIESGQTECPRDGVTAGTWVELLDGETFQSRHLIDAQFGLGGARLAFSEAADLFAFSFDGLEIFSAPDYTDVRVIESVTGFGDVSPNGDLVVSDGGASQLELVDVASGNRVDILRPFSSSPTVPLGIDFSPDGTKVVVHSFSEGTFVWDIESGRQELSVDSGSRGNAQISRDGARMYTSHADGTIKVWTLEPQVVGQTVASDLGTFRWVNANSFTSSGDVGAAQLISFETGFDIKLAFFELSTGSIVGEYAEDAGFAEPLGGGAFVIQEVTGRVLMVDGRSGETVHLAGCTSTSDEPPFLCDDTGEERVGVKFNVSIDGSEILLVYETDPITYEMLDAATLTLTESGEWPHATAFTRVFALSSDWFIGITELQTMLVVDRPTGAGILSHPYIGARHEFSNNGEILALDGETALSFFDVNSWTRREYELGLGFIRGMAFNQDDSILVLGEQDAMTFVDVGSGQVLWRLPIGDASDFHWIDDEKLLFGTSDGLWAVISLNVVELAEAALDNLTRGFTDAECRAYEIVPCPTLEELAGD